MKTKSSFSPSPRHLILIPLAALGAVLALAGCVKQVANQPAVAASDSAPTAPPPGLVAAAPAEVVADDDYVYYPEYEVYYSNRRHLYGYREGDSWYWRSAPPRVGVNVLFSSPSVHMDFHDSPERHHGAVVTRYPHNWKPEPARERDDHRPDDHPH